MTYVSFLSFFRVYKLLMTISINFSPLSILSLNNLAFFSFKFNDILYAIYSEIYNNGYLIIWLSIISVVSIILGIFVITTRNPIISVLHLILLFLIISGYLLLIGVSFIGLSYILVYISAVSILFLFTLMLINIRISELHTENFNSLILGLIISTIIYFSITLNLNFFTLKDSSWYKNFFHSSYDIWDSSIGALNDITAIGTLWCGKSLLCLKLFNYRDFLKILIPKYNLKIVSDCTNNTGKVISQNKTETKIKYRVSKTTNINIIYTSHAMWLLIMSIVLLLAMIGAIIITLGNKPASFLLFSNYLKLVENSVKK
uniref:NADH-ubiquinone oxidoreductase chain 6 n=1 Tax=Arthrobotrys musiformis TaxID=47236 RepID=A0A482EA47_9PEZI|nr:NADH dehydrogenase subunit 6 [Arthrobotrys musiformis]QBM31518.1 NADH dehydrogenase subunit 6 [Arthrobotrys musiformis]QBM31669.1 NADH dehydrogenase subunit 6 [Arthrobotrys musiformis]